ncbi:MAG: response regulator transcription factor [Clostridium sp.]|uniref:Stage 0 sporulation protein A homolog n=1 Tax=Faecalicatena contorta TaxID=39482 RepID=A0A174BKL6_9FIRM|nr:response regulator transcription factor [Faecalicatena contorta]MDU7706018.1 response regulator transcription factor [Clostridium sp.]CUO01197.1 Transcriptional regulatory protein OmpR [[Eubacterium] contortum] [Faecalicatena contorta]
MDRLLFVDDDIDILTLNHSYFTEQGYAVDQAGSAKDALLLINRNTYDCIILDIQMEGQDGFALCRVLREMSNIPIIFLTVLTDEASLEKGFLSGGDDYIVKPYRMKELELRIRARIHPRVHNSGPGSPQEDYRLYICPDEKQAYIGTNSLDLTLSEFQILQFLNQNKGIPYRQDEIYEALWGERYNTHSIQVMIMRIRRKIKALSPEKEYIRTQWGKGYVFTE